MSMAMDDQERARIQTLDVDHRRMNRMLWRRHPLFTLRVTIASRCTADGFWLPIASSLGGCMGYGAGAAASNFESGPQSSERPTRQ